MKYLSICSGIEAASVAFEPLGWTPLAFSEIEPFPRAVLAHHYPDTPIHGDFTELKTQPWIVDADMLCGGTPCFAAGQMVLTDAGYKAIEEVRTGDMVMTHRGRMRRVLRHGSKKALIGTLEGVGLPNGIQCTEEHPFMSVCHEMQSTKRNGLYAKIEHTSEPRWTAAKNMAGEQWCSLLQYETSDHIPKSRLFTEKQCMYLAGFYLGDGWIRRWGADKKMAVVFGINAAKYAKLLECIGGAVHSVSRERTIIRVTIYDTTLARWLDDQFGSGAHNKHIPAWVLGSKWRTILLGGYIDTDGGRHGAHVTINSVSRSLAYGACDILNAEGYVASVNLVETPNTTVIEGRTVNQSNYWSVRAFSRSTSRKSRERHGMLLRKATKYTPGVFVDNVFNIEVDEDNSYILDGAIVHNCQAFSVAGNRQSLADDRGNLTLQFVLLADAIDHLRSTAGREPAWILWENVPGVLSTNDNAFGAFLGGLVGRTSPIPEPADGWTGAGVVDGPTRCAAWRILDAQHFGLAQRRKRVFVLARGGAGRWAVADALLPIIEGGEWHPAPSRSKGKGTARGAAQGFAASSIGQYREGNQLGTLRANGGDIGGGSENLIAHTLRGEGFDASEDGTGRGIPLVAQTSGCITTKYGAQAGQDMSADGMLIPMLVRMREGKEGGGKGPLVSEDQSLTLATGNDQVLAYRIHGENSTAMQGNGVARVADPAELARCLDTCGGYSANQGGNVVQQSMQVRRLTPVECARLQGFPDVREILILHVCSDHQKTSASVEEKSPKLQELAEPASQSKSTESAAFAESHFSASRPKISKHAEVLVEINFEAGTIKGTIQGRELFASAPIADRERRTFLQTPLGSFAQLVARTISEQRRTQRTNAQSGPDSLMDESGNPAVSVSGNAIMECAKNAEELERIKSTSSMFTTLQVGSDTRKGDLPMTTLCSYVVAAIAGFIPSEMWSENFCIRIEARWDYLDITYRNKPAADGNKYKALGNSWAVPCARYIGERIKAVMAE